MDHLSKKMLLANQQNHIRNLPDTENATNNMQHKLSLRSFIRVLKHPQTRVRDQGPRAKTPQELLGVSANHRTINLHTYVCAYLSEEVMDCLKIKSLLLVFTYPAKLIITCREGRGGWNQPLILSLFALVRKAQEGGRESEELAAMFSWLCGDPWQDTVSDVMRM